MILENISKQYRVIRLLRQGNGFQSYLCSYAGRQWIAVCLDAPLTELLFPYFEDLEEGQTFEDLEDIFSWREGLVVILACHSMDHSLKDIRQEEDASYLEKLQIMGEILTGFCVREVPLGIAADLLASGNAGMCTDGVAGAFYDLETPERYPSFTMEQFIQVWCQEIELLFSHEIQLRQARELVDFCQRQRMDPPGSMLELYERFLPVKESLEEQIKQGKFQTDSRSVQAWTTVKKMAAVVKKLLVAGVLIAAIVLLLSQLWQSSDLGKPAFPSIGTVTLQS